MFPAQKPPAETANSPLGRLLAPIRPRVAWTRPTHAGDSHLLSSVLLAGASFAQKHPRTQQSYLTKHRAARVPVGLDPCREW